jgi:hypothetical protein
MSFGETILRKYGWTQGKQNNYFFSKTHAASKEIVFILLFLTIP